MKTKSKNTYIRGDESNGFSLIEVLIALSVFSIGLLAIASMQVSSIGNNSASGKRTEAALLASEYAERMVEMSYNHGDLDTNPASNPHTVTQGNYLISWNVADGAINNTKLIAITVSSPGIKSRPVTITSVKADVI